MQSFARQWISQSVPTKYDVTQLEESLQTVDGAIKNDEGSNNLKKPMQCAQSEAQTALGRTTAATHHSKIFSSFKDDGTRCPMCAVAAQKELLSFAQDLGNKDNDHRQKTKLFHAKFLEHLPRTSLQFCRCHQFVRCNLGFAA